MLWLCLVLFVDKCLGGRCCLSVQWVGSWWCSLYRKADDSTSLAFDWPPSLHLGYSLMSPHAYATYFNRKDRGNKFLWNFDIHLPDYILSQLTPQSGQSELWKPKTSTEATETQNHYTYISSALWNYSYDVSFKNLVLCHNQKFLIGHNELNNVS